MAIKTSVATKVTQNKPPYPRLLRWAGNGNKSLVVLFTSATEGVALMTDKPEDIGFSQEWVNAESDRWVPCTLTIEDDA